MKRRIEISTRTQNLNLTIPTPVDPRKLTKMYGFPSSLTQFFFNPTISLINLCLSSSETVGLNRKPTEIIEVVAERVRGEVLRSQLDREDQDDVRRAVGA